MHRSKPARPIGHPWPTVPKAMAANDAVSLGNSPVGIDLDGPTRWQPTTGGAHKNFTLLATEGGLTRVIWRGGKATRCAARARESA